MARKVQRNFERELRLREADKHATIAMLAANLSHRLGTPLNVIRGRAEHLLRQENNSARTSGALETIISQVDKIAGALRLLHDLGRPRESIRELCDLREIIRSGAELMQTRADEAAVTFNLELGDGFIPVRCDRDQLQQVLVELIGNAISAMAEQGGPLRICTETACGADPRIRVIFEYRGRGVAPEAIPRLFDPFFPGDEARAHDAVDLGLAVAQSITREHDGEIGVEPRAHGACFVLNLPLAASAIDQGAK